MKFTIESRSKDKDKIKTKKDLLIFTLIEFARLSIKTMVPFILGFYLSETKSLAIVSIFITMIIIFLIYPITIRYEENRRSKK